MRDTIRFYLNGELREIGDFAPETTVLTWLREVQRLTGTKEGCAEGDCGACTVIGISLHDGKLRYRAVNACIQLLGTLDGQYLLTVESLKQNGVLHFAQQLMMEKHGSQCGFCTPGIVMSFVAMRHTPPIEHPEKPRDKQAVCDVLAGNLCRCTGYGPIIESGLALDQQRVNGEPDHLSILESTIIEQLRSIQPTEAVRIGSAASHYYQPHNETELLDYLANYPDATVVNGATDVGLWITKQFRELPQLMHPGKVAELNQLDDRTDAVILPSNVTYSEALAWFIQYYPTVAAMMRRIGSTQVRNAGTIVGNIANGSPIGDTPPVLIALGATLTLASQDGLREMPLESYFIEYGKQDRQSGEFVRSVSVPKPRTHQYVIVEKLSKRFDQDITAMLLALSLDCVDLAASAPMTGVRLALGGMAGIPKRAAAAERCLQDQAFTEAAFIAAAEALATDFTPMTDQRASREYRLRAAQNVLRKAYWQLLAPDQLPRLDQVATVESMTFDSIEEVSA